MMTISAIFFVSLVISLVLTPLAKRFCTSCGALDMPADRKVHDRPIPRCGGLAIVLSFFLTLAIGSLFVTSIADLFIMDRKTSFFLLGALMVFGAGLFDDFHRLGHKIKFLFQIIGASLAFWGGVRIGDLSYFGIAFELGWMSYFFTVFWFLLFINAINLIDGLDGLAAGICFFASALMVVLLTVSGNVFYAMIFASLAGTLLGFLRYNFNPASIFMGDGGSYFLGYSIAGLSIISSTKIQMGAVMLIPLLALGVPIFDTILSPVRRFIVGHKMFSADRGHIHHRLLAMGFSTRTIVLFTYGVTVALCLIAIIIVNFKNTSAGLFLGIVALLGFVFVRKLGYVEYFTHEKIYGWFRDITDMAGVSPERRSFLDMQIQMARSKSLRELWEATCHALEMLKFDVAEFRLRRRSSDYEDTADQPRFAQYWIPQQERRKDREKEQFLWTRGEVDLAKYAEEREPLFKIELPLINGDAKQPMGFLWLVKDLGRDQMDYYTLRRVEHLRRTIVDTLQKIQK